MRTETDTAEIVKEYAADLVSGRVFALAAASHRSRRGYEPPITNRDYAIAVRAMSELAMQGDEAAQVAQAMLRAINLYGTASQLCAGLYEQAAGLLREGYDDVIARTGPEGRRFRLAPFSQRTCVLVARAIQNALPTRMQASLQGEGWVLALVAAELGFAPYEVPEWSR